MTKYKLFTPRENEVIGLLLKGKSNKQIALSLGISERTVEFHLRNIYAKMQVASRVELILKRRDITESEEFSEIPVESTVVIPGEEVHNGHPPAHQSRAQSLKNTGVVIKKEIAMTVGSMFQDVEGFLRKHPLFFAALLFLTASMTIRYVVMDLGLYYWLSYILLAVLLGAGGIYLGLSSRKLWAGQVHSHPLVFIAILAALPLLAALLDQVFLYTIVRQTGPIAFSIAGMSMKAMWGISPLGAPYLSTQRSFVSEELWFIAVGYILLFFLIGVVSSRRKGNNLTAI